MNTRIQPPLALLQRQGRFFCLKVNDVIDCCFKVFPPQSSQCFGHQLPSFCSMLAESHHHYIEAYHDSWICMNNDPTPACWGHMHLHLTFNTHLTFCHYSENIAVAYCSYSTAIITLHDLDLCWISLLWNTWIFKKIFPLKYLIYPSSTSTKTNWWKVCNLLKYRWTLLAIVFSGSFTWAGDHYSSKSAPYLPPHRTMLVLKEVTNTCKI